MEVNDGPIVLQNYWYSLQYVASYVFMTCTLAVQYCIVYDTLTLPVYKLIRQNGNFCSLSELYCVSVLLRKFTTIREIYVQGKRPSGRPRRGCEDNIKNWSSRSRMRGLDRIYLAQERDRWRALVNAVLNLRFPQNAGNFFTGWGPVGFWGTTLLHGVSEVWDCHEWRCLEHKVQSGRQIPTLQGTLKFSLHRNASTFRWAWCCCVFGKEETELFVCNEEWSINDDVAG